MISLTSKNPAQLSVDAVVVAVRPRGTAVAAVDAAWLPKELTTILSRDAARLGITGAVDEVRRIPGVGLKAATLVLTGVGDAELDGTDAEHGAMAH